MRETELLNKACDAFFRKYAQTPEEAGYMEAHVIKNEAMFFKSKEIYEAFTAAQDLAKKTIRHLICIILAILCAIGLIAFSPNIPTALLYSIAGVVLILCGFALYFNYRQHAKITELENIYCKNGTHLFYNGEKFYELTSPMLYPETAFL